MQFHVPQFIEVEDKIIGPLSLKQAIYAAGAIGVIFVAKGFVGSWLLALLIASPVTAFGLALAFYKINSRPFISTVEAAVKYIGGSRLYVWKKEPKKIVQQEEEESSTDLLTPKLSDSKLKEIARNLDIQ